MATGKSQKIHRERERLSSNNPTLRGALIVVAAAMTYFLATAALTLASTSPLAASPAGGAAGLLAPQMRAEIP